MSDSLLDRSDRNPVQHVPAWAAIPFALAALAQFGFLPRRLGWLGLCAYVAAAVGMAVLDRRGAWDSVVPRYPSGLVGPDPAKSQPAGRARRWLGALLLLLALAGFVWDLNSYPEHVVLGNCVYVGSLILFWTGSRLGERKSSIGKVIAGRVWCSRTLLVAIVLFGAFMRMYRLAEYPPEIDATEAFIGDSEVLPALRAPLENYYFRGGIEGHPFLEYALYMPFVRLLGSNLTGWRAGPAFLGTLNLLFMYLWVKWFAGRRTALVAAALLASLGLHVAFSRMVWAAIQVPMYLSLMLFLLLRAVRTDSRSDYAACGLVLGYGYQGQAEARILPPTVLVALLLGLLLERRFLRRSWKGAVLLALGMAIALGPLIPYAIQHPEVYMTRMNVTIFSNPWLWKGRSLVQFILDQLARNFFAFNYYSEQVPYYFFRLGPLFEPLPALLMVFGLVYAIRRIRLFPYALILAFSILATVVGGVLTTESPRPTRLLVVSVPLIALAAIGLLCLARTMTGLIRLRRGENVLVALLVGTVCGVGAYQYVFDYYGYYRGPSVGVQLVRYFMSQDPHQAFFIADVDVLHRNTIFKNYQIKDRQLDEVSSDLLISLKDREGNAVNRIYYAHLAPALPNIIDALRQICHESHSSVVRGPDGSRSFEALECTVAAGVAPR